MHADEPILRKCRAVLEALYGDRLKGVVLFGSGVRGEEAPESDIDLLVLLEGEVNGPAEVRRIWDALYPVQLECERAISVMPVEAAEYQRGESILYQNIREEGIAI